MKNIRFSGLSVIFVIMAAFLLFSYSCSRDEETKCDPDIYEENNTFDNAFSLGSVTEEVKSFTGRISEEGDMDFYELTAAEGTHIGIPYASQYFRITVTLSLPADKDYDLYIYNESGSVLGQSAERGNDEEIVVLDWEGAFGADDSKLFGIEVRPYSGDFSCDDYTLTVTMSYSESPW